MTLADLQSNISISATNAVTGDIEWCTGYTQFSTDIGEQAGWYLALQVTPDVEGATVTAAYNGTIRELDNNIFIIRLADGEDTITFTANKEGYTEGRLTLDISGLDKEFINNYCYVRSLTNGITVTPLQFGESKELSGVVPYDTTTSSNKFRLSFRTFNLIPAGSEISVAHQGTPLGSGTFYIYTPQEGDGEPYSAAEIDITLTQAILDSESPTLSTTISPLDGAVTDRFYCSLNVDNVTLEAAPTRMRVIAITDSVSLTPADYSDSYTATGYLPELDAPDGQLTLQCEIDTIPDFNYFYYRAYDYEGNNIFSSTRVSKANMSTPKQLAATNISASDLGAGKTITVKLLGGETTSDVTTFITQSVIDISALTIRPFEANITSETTGIIITPVTYNINKTATGQVPYNSSTQLNELKIRLTYNSYPYRHFYLIQVENSSSTIIYDTGNVQTSLPTYDDITIPITNNEIGTGQYITVKMYTRANASGALHPLGSSLTIDTSALTLEAAPTPIAPPTITGIPIGDPPYGAFEIRPNYTTSTYYPVPNDIGSTLEITQGSSSIDGAGHHVFNYTATDDTTGIRIVDSSQSWHAIQSMNTSTMGEIVWLTPNHSGDFAGNNTSMNSPFETLTTNYTSVSGTAFNCFVVFEVDFSNTDYHYVYSGSTTNMVDISSKQYIGCLYYGNATVIKNHGLPMRLYNSDRSDYIVINIDISGVTITEITT